MRILTAVPLSLKSAPYQRQTRACHFARRAPPDPMRPAAAVYDYTVSVRSNVTLGLTGSVMLIDDLPDLDRGKSNGQDKRIADCFPGMHDIGPEDDVIPLLLERDDLRAGADMKGDAQTAADQDRDRRAIPVRPGMGALLAVRVDAPFQLDIGLVPEAQFGGDELSEKPAGIAYLVDRRIAKIERSVANHTQLLRAL